MEEDPDNDKSHNERNNEMEEAPTLNPTPLNQLDFYQVNLFTYCQTDSTYPTHSSKKASRISSPGCYFS